MAILSIINPEIPAENKDEFLAAWPTIVSDLAAQPGVVGSSGGVILNEDGVTVTDFKFVHVIGFASAKDAEDFASSAWAQEHRARYREKLGADPTVGRFEVPELPKDKVPKPFIQYSAIALDNESKHAEARQAWIDVVDILGKKDNAFGGQSVGDGPAVGLGILGWDSVEEAIAAFQKPEVAPVWAKYQALGQGRNVIIKGL